MTVCPGGCTAWQPLCRLLKDDVLPPADTPTFYATDLPRLPSGSSVPVPWATADAADLAAIDAAFGGTPQKVPPGKNVPS